MLNAASSELDANVLSWDCDYMFFSGSAKTLLKKKNQSINFYFEIAKENKTVITCNNTIDAFILTPNFIICWFLWLWVIDQ